MAGLNLIGVIREIEYLFNEQEATILSICSKCKQIKSIKEKCNNCGNTSCVQLKQFFNNNGTHEKAFLELANYVRGVSYSDHDNTRKRLGIGIKTFLQSCKAPCSECKEIHGYMNIIIRILKENCDP